jgi:hypothetical protein
MFDYLASMDPRFRGDDDRSSYWLPFEYNAIPVPLGIPDFRGESELADRMDAAEDFSTVGRGRRNRFLQAAFHVEPDHHAIGLADCMARQPIFPPSGVGSMPIGIEPVCSLVTGDPSTAD